MDMKAESINETTNGRWRVSFTALNLLSNPDDFIIMRDWILRNIGNIEWQIGTSASIDFSRHEDAMMCFMRFA